MAKRATKPKVTSEELKAAIHDWKEKERRFTAIATGKRKYSESAVDLAARTAEDALIVAHELLRRAAQAKPNETCVAILADGSHLVAVHEPGDQLSNGRVKLQHVSASKVAKLL